MTTTALPRVSGRHHNKALAASRRTGAVELRTQGWTHDAIADELGYANRGSVNAGREVDPTLSRAAAATGWVEAP